MGKINMKGEDLQKYKETRVTRHYALVKRIKGFHKYKIKGELMMNDKLETITNLFEGNEIRSVWDSEKNDYYFSVVDVINVLTGSKNPRKYWSVLKARLNQEGSEVTSICSQLKMLAPDGKMRLRDALDTKGILRLIILINLSSSSDLRYQM